MAQEEQEAKGKGRKALEVLGQRAAEQVPLGGPFSLLYPALAPVLQLR